MAEIARVSANARYDAPIMVGIDTVGRSIVTSARRRPLAAEGSR